MRLQTVRSHRFVGAIVLTSMYVIPSISGCGAGEPALASRDAVAHGKYLVTTMACGDCHTPWKMGAAGPEPDSSLLLSGHPSQLVLEPPALTPEWPVAFAPTNTAMAGPWGISYAANLTPDDTGLGVWSEDVFVQSMRSGKHMGIGRQVLPPMPWPAYAQMTDEDLRAMYRYLMSIPPIENIVPTPTPPAPPQG